MRIGLSIIFVSALVFIASCKRRPEGVLSDKEMVQLMADMEVAESYIQNHSVEMYNDSVRDMTVQFILNKRGIDKARFDSTMTWYGRNIDVYQELYKSVDVELAKRQKNAVGVEVLAMATGTDLWPYSRHLIMTDLANKNTLNFSFESDQLEKGDRLNFKLRANGLDNSTAMIGVDYADGLSAYNYMNQNSTNKIDITLQLDSSRIVKRIFGFVRPKNALRTPVWLDSISLERLPFDSTLYYKIHSQRKAYPPKKREPVKKDTVTGDEQDANLQKILSEDGGLSSVEDRPARTGKREISRNPVIKSNPEMVPRRPKR